MLSDPQMKEGVFMSSERFPVVLDVEGQKATLTANETHMEIPLAEEFEDACAKLLDTGQPELIIDFMQVKTIQSCLIGEVAKTKIIAADARHKLKLITNPKIGEIFKMILSDLVEIEIKK